MEVKILSEAGYHEALYGCGLSYGLTSGMTFEQFKANEGLVSRMGKVARGLAVKDPSEGKFLRFCQAFISINAPRFWWQECSTYAVGCSYLSESTRHTLGKAYIGPWNFEKDGPIELNDDILGYLNKLVRKFGKDSIELRMSLPESFLQTRIMQTNYMALRNIIRQRRDHKLWQWHVFCKEVVAQVEHPEFLQDLLPEDYE